MDEVEKLVNQPLIERLKILSVIYYGEKYKGQFLGKVEFEDLPEFCEWAIKKLGYHLYEEATLEGLTDEEIMIAYQERTKIMPNFYDGARAIIQANISKIQQQGVLYRRVK